jgi:hypothetical protein
MNRFIWVGWIKRRLFLEDQRLHTTNTNTSHPVAVVVVRHIGGLPLDCRMETQGTIPYVPLTAQLDASIHLDRMDQKKIIFGRSKTPYYEYEYESPRGGHRSSFIVAGLIGGLQLDYRIETQGVVPYSPFRCIDFVSGWINNNKRLFVFRVPFIHRRPV